MILFLGTLAAASHGILWLLAQRVFRWNFDAGGNALPHGWSAVALSLTMTIPLLVVPSVYGRFTGTPVVRPGHVLAAFVVVPLAAAGHLFLYGADTIEFKGIRNVFSPLNAVPTRARAFWMECIYAVTHFASIALVYRLIIGSQVGPLNLNTLVPVVTSAVVWLSAVSVFIFLRYPYSVSEKSGIELRGGINALILAVTLQGAMLM